MTSVLTSREDKERALFTIGKLLEQFFFHGLKPADIAAVAEHYTWLKRQPAPLSVNARLETFPATSTTRLTLDLSFAPDVKPFTQN